MNKVRYSYILFLFFSVITYGQVFLSTEISSKNPSTKDVISLTIIKEISGEENFEESTLKLPDLSKFEHVGSGSEQNTFIDPVKKVRINQLIYQLLLVPKQAGVVKIGSALIDVNGKTYKTEPFDIVVKDGGRKTVEQPVSIASQMFLNVKLEDKEVYKNEPVVAILRVFSKDIDHFRKIKNITSPKHKDILVQNVSFGKSDIEPEDKPGLLSQVIGMFVIFPKEDGRVEVPPFTAEVQDANAVKLTSNKTTLNVKKLPEGAPLDYDGFVGDFGMEITNVEKLPLPIEVNKPIDVVLKLVGKGNLSAAKMPKIKSSLDYEIYPPKLIKNLKTDKSGIVGSIEAHYIIVPKKAGNIEIKTDKLTFFNPEKQSYYDSGEKNIVLHAMTPDQIANAKTTVQKVNEYTNIVLDKVNTPVLETQNLKINTKKSFNWEAMFGNLFLIGFVIMVYLAVRNTLHKRRYKTLQLLSEQKEKAPLLNIEETEALLRSQTSFDIDTHIGYLEKLNNQEKYNAFFVEYAEMEKEVNDYFLRSKSITFLDFIAQNEDQEQYELYKLLQKNIEIQKYSPIPNNYAMDEILTIIKKVYSGIVK